ncbi:hypothetical protein M9434_006298 [Picochlorum sp. BPE23]|nr:hypothetical protein M9434_006298 [Picochlorum sp. BPE23]
MTDSSLATDHHMQLDPVTAQLLGTTDTPTERAMKVKEFNEYCNKCINDIRKCLSRQLDNMARKHKEMFGEDHLGKVRIHDVVCHVIHPDGPSAVFTSSAFDHELVKERMVQITNFLRSWQEVYATIHFQGEERFVGSVCDPAEMSDHEALAKLLREQKMKLEEEEMQKLKSDQSIRTGVELCVSAGVGKDESVPFQSRVEQLATVLSVEPADIEGEAKRTLKYGVTKNLYKVAAQKSIGLDFHKTMGECPLYNETADGQEDKCEKCARARRLVGWPGRLKREYVNPKHGEKAY